ncbi:hypothetical protein [Rhizobium sp. Root483D2]|uniref:hypothetical protein n=1 Tax=Rhizobium sp. Root483D2 TaxID=1736545 RepID=UPI0007162543|nr:hypothetical protein [Rhizobium sp. Root483D2]KQY31846.1 hypothetical protein ASD32_04460 [Rhizobium sp. Root483D2]
MKEPSEAQKRLWRARVKSELIKGTSPEVTTEIIETMIDAWRAVEDHAVERPDKALSRRKKKQPLQ